jgi:hypothetical protein
MRIVMISIIVASRPRKTRVIRDAAMQLDNIRLQDPALLNQAGIAGFVLHRVVEVVVVMDRGGVGGGDALVRGGDAAPARDEAADEDAEDGDGDADDGEIAFDDEPDPD